jgi:hypothetical protein
MTRTNVMLVFPPDPELRPLAGRRVPLTVTNQHPNARDGFPVLVDADGEVLTEEAFQQMRARLGVCIETDNVPAVREALGVAQDEPGIVAICDASQSGGTIQL